MIKAIFFDLDNTLCNSDAAWCIAQRETFQRFHRLGFSNISEEAWTGAWTTVYKKLLQQVHAGKLTTAEARDSRFHYLFRELGVPIDKIVEELNDLLSLRYLTSLRLYDDVSILGKLHAYHVGIITNGAHDEHPDSQLSKVRHLDLGERIQSLTISDKVGVRKPNIKIFKSACERAGVSFQKSVFVGDSVETDIVGANRAGITSVLIDRKIDALSPKRADQYPDYSVSNLQDISPA